MNPLLEALGFVGNVLDTPGALVRTALAGRNPLPGIFDPSQRVSGRELLHGLGLVGDNEEGLDLGDVLGFGTEVLTDPVNLLGGTALARLLGARRAGLANQVPSSVPLPATATTGVLTPMRPANLFQRFSHQHNQLGRELGDVDELLRDVRATGEDLLPSGRAVEWSPEEIAELARNRQDLLGDANEYGALAEALGMRLDNPGAVQLPLVNPRQAPRSMSPLLTALAGHNILARAS